MWRTLRPFAFSLVGLFTVSGTARAQGASPVVSAFRENARDIAERTQFAIEAMPAELYSFRAPPFQRVFGRIVFELGLNTTYACAEISGVRRPLRPSFGPTAPKDSLVAHVRSAFQFCDRAIATVPDSILADSIAMDLRFSVMGDTPRLSRAQALLYATAYWADSYAQLANDLRLIGRVPPENCKGEARLAWNLNPLCDSGTMVCIDVGGGRRGYALTLSDAPYSVTSDGRGPYRQGNNVIGVFAARPAVMVLGVGQNRDSVPRGIRVDLSRPIIGDIGVPLGVIVANRDIEVSAQWYTEGDYTSHSILKIPVGTTVEAKQVDVAFTINGRAHALQMGPQPYGHCYSDGTAIHGRGTTTGTIRRESEDRWVVDLPVGSMGRLWDNHLGDPNAVDRGRYYVSLHFVIEK